MKNVFSMVMLVISTFLFSLFISCKEAKRLPAENAIAAINLKKGNVVLCGPADRQFGDVQFATSCREKKEDFNLALALLHSFEYDEAEKVFAKIIDEEPDCAMAYWGVAMSNYHTLWAPPTSSELEKGAKAIAIAQSLNHCCFDGKWPSHEVSK